MLVISCDKQKADPQETAIETIESENVQPEITTDKPEEENKIVQFSYDCANKDEILGIIPGKDGKPDEVDIASGHIIILNDWYSKYISPDEKYIWYGGLTSMDENTQAKFEQNC